MKSQKILLEIEDEDEEITLGLIRLAKEVPEHELFYQLNVRNSFKLTRIADLVYCGAYYDYFFPGLKVFIVIRKFVFSLLQTNPPNIFRKKFRTNYFQENRKPNSC